MYNETSSTLQFYGRYGGFVPFVVLLAVIVVLAFNTMASTRTFWAGGYLGVAAGLLFCKNKSDYCKAIVRGIGNQTGVVVIVAWIFASVLGKIVSSAGLLNGILWFGLATGFEGSYFTLTAFLSAMLFSMSTGTSNGTVLALTPVMFPAGVALGADPTFLALGILSGAAFGDNVAPISDTTILSAYTQGATMKSVVRSRLPLAMVSAAMAAMFLWIVGGGGEAAALPMLKEHANPESLLLLVALFVVLVAAQLDRNIIESLLYGSVTAVIIGVIIGSITLSDIFSIPSERGQSTGLLQDGVNDIVGAIVFVVFVMAIVQILRESGLLERLLNLFQEIVARTVRGTELSIFGISALVSSIVTSNGAAILLVGPTIARQLGQRFHLAPHRIANLMDCGVCSVFYMLPWSLAVLVWYSAVHTSAGNFGIVPPPITSSLMAPYPWALLAVMMFSILTGWNRSYDNRESLSDSASGRKALASVHLSK